jgi:hypothetical protein
MSVEEIALKIVEVLSERSAECYTGNVTFEISYRDGGIRSARAVSDKNLMVGYESNSHQVSLRREG